MRKILLSVFFCLSLNLLHSEILPTDIKNEDILDFSGGLNTNTIPYKLNKNQSPAMSNVLIDEVNGRLKTVGGYTILGSTSTLNKINFIYEFKDVNNEKTYLVSDSEKVLSTKDFQNYTLLIEGLNANALIDAVQVENKTWMTNGQNPVFTYNGSTVVVLDGNTYSGTPTPNVPKGKYIEFYRGKVFIYNNPLNTSALYFTDLVSTANLSISPDHYLAWNPENQLDVGYGDGQNGTALFTYRGQLFAGKEYSIYTINGTDKYSYQWSKTDAKVGISGGDSMDVLDNLVYIKAKNDGIYAFNGNITERITDDIKDEMNEISANEARVISDIWETDSDFNKGLLRGTSVTADTIELTTMTLINYATPGFDPATVLSDTAALYVGAPYVYNSSTPYIIISSEIINPNNGFGRYMTGFTIDARSFHNQTVSGEPSLRSGCCYDTCEHGHYQTLLIKFLNSRTGQAHQEGLVVFATNTASSPDNLTRFIDMVPDNFIATIDDFRDGNITYEMEVQRTNCNNGPPLYYLATVSVSSIGTIGQSNIYVNNTSGTYQSSIATITTITSWDSFNSINNVSGGAINFFYRTSSTLSGVYLNSWNPISEGAVLNSSSTDKYVQWGATITATESTIDNVSISHNESGTNDSRPMLNYWKNRLWVAVSTDSIGTIIYVKTKNTNSNPNAWQRIDGIKIKSLLNVGEYFYAGSSTAGVILRLDHGTNFNGSAIPACYETPDLDFGNPFFKKDILKYYIDVEKQNGKTLRIGTSKDGGNFTYQNIDCSGSGRLLRSINDVPYKNGKYFRFRFENNELDKGLDFNALSVIYKSTQRD